MPKPLMDTLESRHLFATLTAGITTPTVVNTSKPMRNWSVTLKAGQAIMVAAGEATTSAFQPELVLITPKHKAMARSSGDSGAMISKVAPVSGTYIVRVLDVSRTHASTVNVTAFFTGSTPVTDGDDGGTLISGRAFEASIAPGDLDVWKINATEASAYMTLATNENRPGRANDVGLALFDANGVGITAKESPAGFNIDRPATKAGTYYAVEYEPGQNASGQYLVSLGLAPGPQTPEDVDTQQTLQPGVSRTGGLPNGDTDVFSLPLTKGHTITVTAAQSNSTVSPLLQIMDPTGNLITQTSSATSATVTFTPTVNGTYFIELRNRDPDTGDAYVIKYTTT